LFVVLEFK